MKRKGFTYIEMLISGCVISGLALTSYAHLSNNIEKISLDYINYYENFNNQVIEEVYNNEDLATEVNSLLKSILDLNSCIEIDNETYCKIRKEN
jgi:Tfp pilus assembly protein PilE